MSPKVWLPVIIVFLVVLLFAGMRLSTLQPAADPPNQAVQADPNLAQSLLRHLLGPQED